MTAEDDRTDYERQWAGERPAPKPKPEARITGIPANMDSLVAAVQASGWDPIAQAQMLGAAFFDVETQMKIAQAATAAGEAGASTDSAALEADTLLHLRELKVRAEAERRLASENFRGSEELTWEDLAAAKKEYLVQDLVPQGAFVTLCARSNLGKTFTYLDMTLRMVTGMEWLGKTTRKAKVLIVLGEGKAGFLGRIQAWLTAHGRTVEEVQPWLAFVDRANLNNDESLARVADVAKRHEAELVIYDTWAGVSGIQKEDDAQMNSRTFERIEGAMPDVTHMFIHHPRKAEQDTESPVMRGSGAFEGRMDVVMMMYRDQKFVPASGEAYEFIALSTEQDHNGKSREAQTETIRGLYLDEVVLGGETSRVMRQVTSEVISREGRKVREHLTRDMSAEQFSEVAKLSRATAYRYLQKAAAEGVCVYDNTMPGAAVFKPSHKWAALMSKADR